MITLRSLRGLPLVNLNPLWKKKTFNTILHLMPEDSIEGYGSQFERFEVVLA